ncbi:hypothetical protein [Streptomyces sp. SID14515]|nr:hypothetical protein [Streptomyces sp. SID14515]NEB36431.1 hypothetical protein [Streptomyces sp. SID14515]
MVWGTIGTTANDGARTTARGPHRGSTMTITFEDADPEKLIAEREW